MANIQLLSEGIISYTVKRTLNINFQVVSVHEIITTGHAHSGSLSITAVIFIIQNIILQM